MFSNFISDLKNECFVYNKKCVCNIQNPYLKSYIVSAKFCFYVSKIASKEKCSAGVCRRRRRRAGTQLGRVVRLLLLAAQQDTRGPQFLH